MSAAQQLLQKHALISEQVSREQLRIILQELEGILDRNIKGAVVEFGCYIGTTSLFIRRLLDTRRESREFHVYDSFEGLPAKAAEDISAAGEQFVAGELAVNKKQFLAEFQKARLEPPEVHKSWFSELTEADIPEKIAFAFLDGDFYDSIHDSLRWVLPRMQSGGVIIFDDYAREALPGVARAVRDFASELAPNIRVQHNLGIARV